MTHVMSRHTLFSTLALLTLTSALIMFASPTLPAARAQSEDGVVILVNARNPTRSISPTEATKLFLGQTAFWHGVVPVKVVVRPDGSTAAKSFYERVLKMTPQAFRKHWDELQLAGRGVAPRSYGSVEEMAQAVASAAGGIGFALESEAWKVQTKGIRIINVK